MDSKKSRNASAPKYKLAKKEATRPRKSNAEAYTKFLQRGYNQVQSFFAKTWAIIARIPSLQNTSQDTLFSNENADAVIRKKKSTSPRRDHGEPSASRRLVVEIENSEGSGEPTIHIYYDNVGGKRARRRARKAATTLARFSDEEEDIPSPPSTPAIPAETVARFPSEKDEFDWATPRTFSDEDEKVPSPPSTPVLSAEIAEQIIREIDEFDWADEVSF